jgi:hypothetical protein
MAVMRRINPDARRYGLAILVALVALLLRRMLSPLLGAEIPITLRGGLSQSHEQMTKQLR